MEISPLAVELGLTLLTSMVRSAGLINGQRVA